LAANSYRARAINPTPSHKAITAPPLTEAA
jgi:hypothetical protein